MNLVLQRVVGVLAGKSLASVTFCSCDKQVKDPCWLRLLGMLLFFICRQLGIFFFIIVRWKSQVDIYIFKKKPNKTNNQTDEIVTLLSDELFFNMFYHFYASDTKGVHVNVLSMDTFAPSGKILFFKSSI